jgi:WD40 repeat protein
LPKGKTVPKGGAVPRTDLHGDPLPDGAIARLGTLRFRQRSLHAVALSPDGMTIAADSKEKDDRQRLRLWDVTTGKEIRRMAGSSGHTVLVWSPNGKLLASGSDGRNDPISLWDAATGKEIRQLTGFKDAVNALAWSPDSKRLASGGDDKSISLWEVATGTEVRRLYGDEGTIESLAWSPDGAMLASASRDGLIRLWDPTTGEEIRRLARQKDGIGCVAWSPDGKTLASAGWDYSTHLWEAATGKQLCRLDSDTLLFTKLAWSPDGKRLAAEGLGGTIRLFDAAIGKEVKTLDVEGSSLVAWSPDGKRLVSVWGDAIRLWDLETGRENQRFAGGHMAPVGSVAWSPDGKTLASGGWDATIRLWTPATGQQFRVLKGHRGSVEAVAWSPDGKTLASGDADGTISLWDETTGQEIQHLQLVGESRVVRSLIWSPDGKTLASAEGNSKIRFWEATTGKELRRFYSYSSSLAWSPDGEWLASFNDTLIRVFATATGKEVRQLKLGIGVFSVAWSPDGRILASGCGDGTLRLCEAATGKEIGQLPRQDGGANPSLAWSPDGKLLAAGSSQDGTISVWETATQRPVYGFSGHSDSVLSVAWSPDGKLLASASLDNTLLIWAVGNPPDARPGRLAEAELKSCWADLVSDDAARAHQAVRTLSRGPKDSVPFLAERLRPMSTPDPKHVARLIADLDHDEFSVRQKADDTLATLGELAEPAVRRALRDNPSAESRKRLEELLEKTSDWSGEQLRVLRTLTVLEDIATPEARQILESLAKGDSASRVTQEARASLERLARRPRSGQTLQR